MTFRRSSSRDRFPTAGFRRTRKRSTPPSQPTPKISRDWPVKRRFRKCAGINRHGVRNERVLQERRERIHLGPESCGGRREVSGEAKTGVLVGLGDRASKNANWGADS